MFQGVDSGTCGHGTKAVVIDLSAFSRVVVCGITGLTFTRRSGHFAVDLGSAALADEATLNKDGDSHHKITHGRLRSRRCAGSNANDHCSRWGTSRNPVDLTVRVIDRDCGMTTSNP